MPLKCCPIVNCPLGKESEPWGTYLEFSSDYLSVLGFYHSVLGSTNTKGFICQSYQYADSEIGTKFAPALFNQSGENASVTCHSDCQRLK